MTEKREWQPPPEVQNHSGNRGPALRLGLFCAVLLALYLAAVAVKQTVFTAQLRIVGTVAPAEAVAADSPVTVGLRVSNDRWGDGAAYVVLAIEGETEMESPVIPVRKREQATVTLTAHLPPGWRSGALILYDAADNSRVDARHGIPVRVGTAALAVTAAQYPASVRRGDTLPLTLTATNGGTVDALAVPIAVVLSETGTQVAETDGHSATIPRGGTLDLQLSVATHRLVPGSYFLAILLTDPATGQRLGEGLYRRPLTVLP